MVLTGVVLVSALAAPPVLAATEGIDLSGRWRLNADLSEPMPQPPDDRAGGPGRGGGMPGAGGRGGGMGGRGGMSGGRGGAMPGARPGGDRPNPEQMAKTRDAMRAVLDAPTELVVTRRDDEVVFTSGSGDIIRVLVTGRKMKTTAGGAEHEVKASYKNDTLTIEREFGRMKVLDTYRLSADRRQLERVTRIGEKPIRRVYDRVD